MSSIARQITSGFCKYCIVFGSFIRLELHEPLQLHSLHPPRCWSVRPGFSEPTPLMSSRHVKYHWREAFYWVICELYWYSLLVIMDARLVFSTSQFPGVITVDIWRASWQCGFFGRQHLILYSSSGRKPWFPVSLNIWYAFVESNQILNTQYLSVIVQ